MSVLLKLVPVCIITSPLEDVGRGLRLWCRYGGEICCRCWGDVLITVLPRVTWPVGIILGRLNSSCVCPSTDALLDCCCVVLKCAVVVIDVAGL